MSNQLHQLKKELSDELQSILTYWSKNTLDEINGGFIGRIDHFNNPFPDASKGIILNTRILWSFSAATNYLNTSEYDHICNRAFDYIKGHFVDQINGGVFWELDHEGNPINTRKQVYAQAFAIYSLSEYCLLTKNEEAKSLALEIFELIEKHSNNSDSKGYLEAFGQEWEDLADLRLSPKDINSSKTMNTHLHILEAYTTLLKISDGNHVKTRLRDLIDLLHTKFLTSNYQFQLFFDDNWNSKSQKVSFGHDIESAWLILEAAKQINDSALIKQCELNLVNIADTFLREGLDEDGSVINERDDATGAIDHDRHWWPQVEAMIGLGYAYKLTGDENYVNTLKGIWEYVKANIIDHDSGEWYFRVDRSGTPYAEDKVSMWKAPYHSSRACMVLNEIL